MPARGEALPTVDGEALPAMSMGINTTFGHIHARDIVCAHVGIGSSVVSLSTDSGGSAPAMALFGRC